MLPMMRFRVCCRARTYQKYVYAVVFLTVCYHAQNNLMSQNVRIFDYTVIDEPNEAVNDNRYHPIQGPVRVVILAYQRTGSTYFGQLFNQNQRAFYTFEPVDGLYSAMYGTRGGFNSPSDIMCWWNGTRRALPEFEIQSTAVMLSQLLSCEHAQLPYEVLLHPFWYGFKSEHIALTNFTNCLNRHVPNMAKCRGAETYLCNTWFGQKASSQEWCRKHLWVETSSNDSSPTFKHYKQCMGYLRKKARDCFLILNDTCIQADIRATKVVRLSMKATYHLLKENPHTTKIIHLLRDPKAMAQSRMKYESVRSHWAGKNKTREAQIICQVMLEDLKVRQELEVQYPLSFHQVIYEDFIKDPEAHINDIYRFIGKSPSWEVLDYFNQRTSLNNTVAIQGLGRTEALDIDRICSPLYRYMNFTWPTVDFVESVPTTPKTVIMAKHNKGRRKLNASNKLFQSK